MKIQLFTDAWEPQVNGVVRTLKNLVRETRKRGHEMELVTPQRFRTFPMPTYPEIRLSIVLARTMRGLIDEARPDTIHISTEGPIGMAARAACRSMGLPFTTSYHTRFPEYVRARVPVPIEWTYGCLRKFHNSGTACLVPTPSIGAELTGRGFRNLVTWTRGVDHQRFNPSKRREGGLLAGLPRPIFLYAGRLAVEKNIDAFLELDLPGSKVVVGDGPDMDRLKRGFPAAHFTGVRHGEELSELYASADVFMFPSLTDTFGNVILEALASGTPVAAFPVAGPIDILTGSGAGACDQDLGRAAMDALVLDRDEARNHSLTYSWEKCADIFLQVAEANAGRMSARRGDRLPLSA